MAVPAQRADETTAKVLIGSDMESAEIYPFAGGRVAIFSTLTPTRHKQNEDTAGFFITGPQEGVLVVADGAGGQPAGAEAASLAIKAIQKSVLNARTSGMELREAILDGFEKANRAVIGLGVGAATTLVVGEVSGDTFRPYHVGDSIILICGQRGRQKHLTTSHSPVGYAVEAGILDAREALYHEALHLVSNFVGTEDMAIEIGPTMKLASRDTVMLASDGLSDNLHTDEIIKIIRKGTLEDVAATMVRSVKKRMMAPGTKDPSKPDDLSFIMFRTGG